jgi:hypothetical protein
MYKEFITEAEKSVELYGSTFDSLILQVRVYAVAGARAKALAILNQAAQRSNRPEFDTWEMAKVCAFLGETKGALDWLETAYDQRNPYLVFLNVKHDLDALHSERRFQDLVRRMNLPATKR